MCYMEFPFDNNLMKPEDRVGTMGAKSMRWLISYESSPALGGASR